MYARTGWWPLVRKSENWDKAIKQFGMQEMTNVSSVRDEDLTKELGASVRIRQVVLDAFRGRFLLAAKTLKDEYDADKSKKNSNVPCTVYGKGFCKEQDLQVVKANDLRIANKKEAKVGKNNVSVCFMVVSC